MSDYAVITTTTDTQERAQAIADHLLNASLAACVQTSSVTSTYLWEGKIEQGTEVLLTIKTLSNLFEDVETAIKQVHNYDTPEIVMTPITRGSTDYLNWLRGSVTVSSSTMPHHQP